MDYKELYKKWCTDSYFDESTRNELKKIADRYNHISSDFEMEEKDRKPDQYHDNENKTSDKEKNDKDTQ